MSIYNELPVYKATYDLLLEMFKFTKELGKEYKYTVGESLKKETIELITLIYRANSSPAKTCNTLNHMGAYRILTFTYKTYIYLAPNKFGARYIAKCKIEQLKQFTKQSKTRHEDKTNG
jgi:hypothetical protein